MKQLGWQLFLFKAESIERPDERLYESSLLSSQFKSRHKWYQSIFHQAMNDIVFPFQRMSALQQKC